MTQHNAPADRPAQAPHYQRPFQAHIVDAIVNDGLSQRAAARQHDIPRTTVSSWITSHRALTHDDPLALFLASPVGLEFVHRLVCAAHFVFGLVGLTSCRLLALFFDLCGLGRFVAASKTACNRRHRVLVDLVNLFALQQQRTLAPLMRADLADVERDITICCDETFHPQPCLVAIEPMSNFIFVEHYAQKRDAATWTLNARAALKGFPLNVTQVVADGARALASMARHFNAHLSPDLMHALQPISRKVLAPAARRVSVALSKQTHPDLLKADQDGLELIRKGVEQIKAAYHPVDLDTGQWQSTKEATERIKTGFEDVREGVKRLGMGKSAMKAVDDSAKHIEQMIVTLGRAESKRRAVLKGVESPLREEVSRRARRRYLEKMGRSAKASERKRLEALGRMQHEGGKASAAVAVAVDKVLRIFERSSSCVEGRNGYLALSHHARHRMSPATLRALTTVHNYVLRRDDGTTAANRLFGRPHDSLFDFVLQNMPFPASPRSRKPTAQAFN